MSNQDTWKDIFDSNPMNDIVKDLNEITKLADKQAFGMVRPEHTKAIRELLATVRRKLHAFEVLLPASGVDVTTINDDIRRIIKERKVGSGR